MRIRIPQLIKGAFNRHRLTQQEIRVAVVGAR
jgi:hypothetical protein